MDEQSIFVEALSCDNDDDRERLLVHRCGGDSALKNRVLELLKNYESAGSFLESPALQSPSTASASVLVALDQAFGAMPRVVLSDTSTSPIERPIAPQPKSDNGGQKYQIHGEIAQGGMGAIVKCRDTDLGRDLVLKVLLEQNASNPDYVRRFIEEAQISGQLEHPGIVPVHEVGQLQDGRPYFSMKFVKGRTLSSLLRERVDGADELSRWVGIFEQICQTMSYSHTRNVIHRDLKPSNIMVGNHGEVQVMDWGLAKVLSQGHTTHDQRVNSKDAEPAAIRTYRQHASQVGTEAGADTTAGSVMGTFAYMPPEQALGDVEQLDERADVFALGAILAEILTGKPPYVAKDHATLHRMACRGDLSDCRSRIEHCTADVDLKQLAMDCLQADPAMRPPNATVVTQHLLAYQRGLQQRVRDAELESVAADTRAAEAQRHRRLARTISTLLLIGLIASMATAIAFNRLASRNDDLRQVAELRSQLQKISRISAESRALGSEFATTSTLLAVRAVELSLGIGGAELPAAHAALLQATQDISLVGRPIKVDADEVNGLWMTHAYVIALCDQRLRMWQYPDSRGNESLRVPLSQSETIASLELSRDGLHMVTSGDRVLYWDLRAPRPHAEVIDVHPSHRFAMSDNGRWLITSRSTSGDDGSEVTLRRWDLAAANRRPGQSFSATLSASNLAISNDGRWAAARDTSDNKLFLWDLESDDVSVQETDLIGNRSNLVFSPDSQFLVARGGDRICAWNLSNDTPLTSKRQIESRGNYLQVSPDSRWVYGIGTKMREFCRWSLVKESADESPVEFIGPMAGFTSLAMSPDCRWFLGGACDGNAGLWSDLDAPSPSQRPVSLKTHMLGPTTMRISSDGRWIATSYPDGLIRLRDLHYVSESPFQFEGPMSTRFAPIDISSDGRWIASSTESNEVVLRDTQARSIEEAERFLKTKARVTNVAFSPDDRWLVAGIDDGTFAIWNLSEGDFAFTKHVIGDPDNTRSFDGPMAISSDSRILTTAHADHAIRIWDLENARFDAPIAELRGHTKPILAIGLTPDGRWLASSDNDEKNMSMRLWDLTSDDPQASVIHLGQTRESTFSLVTDAQSRWLVAGCGEEVHIWDLHTMDTTRSHRVIKPTTEDEKAFIWRLTLSPNGRWLFTSRMNATAQLFDLTEGDARPQRIRTPGVQDAMMSPDGKWLVMCKRGSNLQVFDLTAEDPTKSWRVMTCHGDTLWRVAISADSQWLATSSGEGRVRRWNLDVDWLLGYARRQAGRELTVDEQAIGELLD